MNQSSASNNQASASTDRQEDFLVAVSLCVLPKFGILPDADDVDHDMDVETRTVLQSIGLRIVDSKKVTERCHHNKTHTQVMLYGTVVCSPEQLEELHDKLYYKALDTVQKNHKRAHSPVVTIEKFPALQR